MYGVFFRSGDVAFVDPLEFAPPAAKRWKAAFDGTGLLTAVLPSLALGGGPFASWVLARLAGLSETTSFPADFVGGEGELGGFRLRLLAVRGAEPFAKLRLEAERGGIELTATAAGPEAAESAARDLVAALTAEPLTLGRCRIAVRAQELGGIRNEYGYDGVGLLGHHNVYE